MIPRIGSARRWCAREMEACQLLSFFKLMSVSKEKGVFKEAAVVYTSTTYESNICFVVVRHWDSLSQIATSVRYEDSDARED
jgi:hypothetical protein